MKNSTVLINQTETSLIDILTLERKDFSMLSSRINHFNSNMMKLVDVSLHCSHSPKIEQKLPLNIDVMVGEQVLLKCHVKTQLPVKYNWIQGEKYLDGEIKNELLFVASLENSGIYACFVSSSVGHARSNGTLITVYSPPKLLAQPKSIQHIIAQTGELQCSFFCNVSGYPKPIIEWYFKPYASKQFHLLPNKSSAQLLILNPNASIIGIYHCKAFNKYGSVKSRDAYFDILGTMLMETSLNISVKAESKSKNIT